MLLKLITCRAGRGNTVRGKVSQELLTVGMTVTANEDLDRTEGNKDKPEKVCLQEPYV